MPIGGGWPFARTIVAAAAVLAAVLHVVAALVQDVSAADGDARRGEDVFSRACAVCHATLAGYHKQGPSLSAVVGRRAGTAPAFTRYMGLRDSDVIWNEGALDRWLADPRGFLGGRDTNMTFKLPDARDRADVIAYLKALE